jgi:hypothetical protein
MRWTYRTARVEACVHSGIADWRVMGVVTDELLPKLLVDAMCWHEEAGAVANVCDYRGAVMAAPLGDFLILAEVIVRAPRPIAAPAVIVPACEQVTYFRRYAAAMRRRGVERTVSLDFSAAQAWALSAASARLALASAARSGLCTRARRGAVSPSAIVRGIQPGSGQTDCSLR